MTRFRSLLPLAIGAVLFAALAALLFVAAPRRPAPPSVSPPAMRTPVESFPPAPDFRLRAFDGGPVALSDFRGQAVVLNFWASWCTPCRQEMPNLERAWREFRDQGLVVLGVDVLDDAKDAAAFLKALGITYPNVFDPEQTRMRAYRVSALPTTILIDRAQRVRARYVGGYVGERGYANLHRQIRDLLRVDR